MFELFQSIFTRNVHRDTPYPADLIEAAIERAVDGTDPRLRAVSGYRKHLREPVLHALDHVVQLVDSLAPPLEVSAESYRDDALLGALFASPQRMLDVLARDRELTRALADGTHAGQPQYGLLVARVGTKRILGFDEADGAFRSDVEQTVVSFDNHRLIDVQENEQETRRALKRRAFDYILTQALRQLNMRRESRIKLSGQQQLLRRKYELLRRAGWSFDAGTANQADMEHQLRDIESALAAFGPRSETLTIHLGILAQALNDAQGQLWLEPASIILDHRHIQRVKLTSGARHIHYQCLCDVRDERAVVLLLRIDPVLLPEVDFFREHARYFE